MRWLIAWLERASKREPVPGWLTQWLLLAAFAVATWKGVHPQATTYLVGALVVGVLRQIERARGPVRQHPGCVAPHCLRGGKCTGPCKVDR